MGRSKARDSRIRELELALALAEFQIENLNSVVLRWDRNGIVTFLNTFGCQLFGWDRGEVVGRPIVGTLVDEQEITGRDLKAMIEELLIHPEAFETNENENMCKDGSRVWMLWRNRPILGPDGELTEILTVGIDISERKRLDNELQAAYSRMEQELEFGRTIQMTLVPEVSSVISTADNLVAAATLRPARELGGDFYDILRSSDGRVWFCIGDVSGKGVAAALYMAVAKTLFTSLASKLTSPCEVVTRMNDELAKDNPSSMFVTLFVAVIDPASGNVTFTNAGHNLPFVCRDQDRVDSLDQLHGPVVGAVEDLVYGEDHLTLQELDVLFLYTDGVTEAMDVEHQLYGEQRLLNMLRSTSMEPSAIVTAIVDSVDSFAGTEEQADDITMFVIRRGTTASARASG
jgi:PAS domain S-box-containing protein